MQKWRRRNTVTRIDSNDTHGGYDSIGEGAGGIIHSGGGDLIYSFSQAGDNAHVWWTYVGTNIEEAYYAPTPILDMVKGWGRGQQMGFGRPATWIKC